MIGRLKLYAVIAGLVFVLVLSMGQHRAAGVKLRQALNTNKKQKGMQDAEAKTSGRKSDVAQRLRDEQF